MADFNGIDETNTNNTNNTNNDINSSENVSSSYGYNGAGDNSYSNHNSATSGYSNSGYGYYQNPNMYANQNSAQNTDGYNNSYAGPYANEFSYNTGSKKMSAGKKALIAVIAVLCVGAISITTIVGFSLATGKPFIGIDNNSSTVNGAGSDNSKSTIDRDNLPTLEQLATPDDAMKIPDIVEKVSPSVVGISCMLAQGTATGSGIIMSEDGYIITNAHVVSGAKTIDVVLPSSYEEKSGEKNDSDSSSESSKAEESKADNLTYTAELVGKDTQTDIAVLKIDKKGLTKAEFGKSQDLKVGELSIVIGNPLGLDLANSVTAGIISATNRTLTIEDRTMNLIQTDASVNNGNSGGPLINAYGQVIGITSAKVSTSVGEGLGFAIPMDEAVPIIKDLMENGYVKGRPSIGISGTDVTSTMAAYYGIPQGFIVKKVTEGGAAEKAGIQVNDVIIGINDTVVTSINELNEVKNKCKVGDTVTLTVYRNGKKSDFKVKLTEASNEETESQDDQNNNDQQQTPQDNFDDYYRQYYDYYNNFGGFGQ